MGLFSFFLIRKCFAESDGVEKKMLRFRTTRRSLYDWQVVSIVDVEFKVPFFIDVVTRKHAYPTLNECIHIYTLIGQCPYSSGRGPYALFAFLSTYAETISSIVMKFAEDFQVYNPYAVVCIITLHWA